MSVFFQEQFKTNILDRKIVGFSKVDAGGDEPFPALKLDNGALLIIQRDAEGNGGGFVQLVSKDDKDLGCGGASC